MQLTPAHITNLGGDVRYSYCAQQLRQAGWQVDTFQVQGSPDTAVLPGLFQPQRDYLLPYPAFNARGYIPFLQGETILHCSDLTQGPITGSRFLCRSTPARSPAAPNTYSLQPKKVVSSPGNSR